MDSDTSRSPEPRARITDASPPGGSANELTVRRLRREVLYPQRQNTGVGVMLVASAAMFFAVASSAFILRAQMPLPEQCPGNSMHLNSQDMQSPHEARIEAVEVELVDFEALDANEAQAVPCGEPIIQDGGEGPSSIIFRLCGDQF